MLTKYKAKFAQRYKKAKTLLKLYYLIFLY
ncbi:hypothetical protein D0T56_04760 [Dysgonomonas sp. 520]|nr:hypothetical protein [Dysgonomonas sp. 520]